MSKKYMLLGLAVLHFCFWGLTVRVAGEQAALSARLIRLHIVAASDDPADQARKLRVRDALLPELAALTAGCADAEAAGAAIRAGLPALAERAARALGTGEAVTASLAVEPFPRRDYDSFSLPAGPYRALRITLGEGQGHNWWCVAFPALCLPAPGDFDEAAEEAGLSACERELMEQRGETVRFKFRLLDLLAELFG